MGKPIEMAYAYIAGIIDGEGCITIERRDQYYKKKNGRYYDCGITYTLFISVTQIDDIIPKYLYGIFGGSHHPVYRNKPDGRHTYYRWQIASNKARNVLKKIIPYLRLKKQQALLAIEFQLSMNRVIERRKVRNIKGNYFVTDSERKYRENCYLKLREMKRAVVETKSAKPEMVCDSPNPQETVRNI
jgi:hypothetical protein